MHRAWANKRSACATWWGGLQLPAFFRDRIFRDYETSRCVPEENSLAHLLGFACLTKLCIPPFIIRRNLQRASLGLTFQLLARYFPRRSHYDLLEHARLFILEIATCEHYLSAKNAVFFNFQFAAYNSKLLRPRYLRSVLLYNGYGRIWWNKLLQLIEIISRTKRSRIPDN